MDVVSHGVFLNETQQFWGLHKVGCHEVSCRILFGSHLEKLWLWYYVDNPCGVAVYFQMNVQNTQHG